MHLLAPRGVPPRPIACCTATGGPRQNVSRITRARFRLLFPRFPSYLTRRAVGLRARRFLVISEHVRTGRRVAAGLVTAMALGCGGEPQGEMTADLERDLALAANAQRPGTQVVSAIEGGPRGAPSGTQRGMRDQVTRPKRAPKPTPQAEVQETAVLPSLENAPAPAVVVTERTQTAPAPIPEPSVTAPNNDPIGTPSGGRMDEGRGRGQGGVIGIGGGIGGVIGVIIRGGAAGEDHCEIHDRRRGRGRMPIPLPGGMGGIGGAIGGIGGGIGGVAVPRPRW